ncbi:hypothetical protein ACHAPT_001476 [Fusarium lateritium]
MLDEITVLGEDSDAKRLPSPEQQQCLDEITIPPTESTDANDKPTIPSDGDDTLSSEWHFTRHDELDPATTPMPPPGWPSDEQHWRMLNALRRQTASSTSVPNRKQPERESSFKRLFGLFTSDGAPQDASCSAEHLQDGVKPFAQQAPPPPPSVRSKPSRASTTVRRLAKQGPGSKSSQRRSRKGTARDDNDQDDDCLMVDADLVVKKHEDNGPWACPFFRKDPLRHMECITLTLNRIQDVKQHLSRRHTAEYFCSRCFEEFPSSPGWEEHVRFRMCQQRPCPPDRVSPQAQDLLKRRVDRTLSSSKQWYEIWKTLFEDAEKPQSPHQGGVMGEAIGIIRDFWDAEGGQLVCDLASSKRISVKEAGLVQELVGGLLDQVQDRFEPVQRDLEAPSNADNRSRYMADQTERTLDLGSSVFLPPGRDYDATPKLSKSPSPLAPTPVLPDISSSNFQPCFPAKLESFPISTEEAHFDAILENRPYPNSSGDYAPSTSTFSSPLEGNGLEARGLQNDYYMNSVPDFAALDMTAFAPNNLVWTQYPRQIDFSEGNDVNCGE